MQPHKILLLGANGQLGHELATALQTLGEVKALTRSEADLSQHEALRASLAQLMHSWVPTVIVNAAAYTAVDKAESEPHLAHAVNAASVAVLGEVAQECCRRMRVRRKRRRRTRSKRR